MWEDRVLYLGPDVPSTLHAHHAVQVCVSLSEPLRFRSSLRARWQGYGGAIIPSDVPHQTDPVVPLLATFWLDAETPEAKRLTASQVSRTIVPIAPPQLRVLLLRLHACWENGYNGSEAVSLLDEVIETLSPCVGPSPRPTTLDPRVARAHERLRSAPMRRLAFADLAAAVSLSPSRLGHLLRSHLGLPVRRYLLWLRLRDALQEIARGAPITQAAHAAGFADAPHLDRTCEVTDLDGHSRRSL